MVRIVEFIGTALTSLSLFGLFLASIMLFLRNRKPPYLWLMLGFLISEMGRWFRILGPTYSTTKGEDTLILTEGSTLFVFLAHNLAMPVGLTVAMIALIVIAVRTRSSL